LKPAAEKNEKESSVTPPPRACFVCGKPGHIARVCPLRKSPEAALIVADRNLDEDDNDHGFLGDAVKEAAYISKEETVLLFINDAVFDNGSTIHLIKNPKFKTPDQNSSPKFKTRKALSSSMEFNLTQKAYESISKGNLETSELFITVQTHQVWLIQELLSSMIKSRNVSQFITTVAENLVKYTRREVLGARKACELLARLGYPFENAIAMLRDGSGSAYHLL
jgi:Zinc knuckle